MFFSAPLMMTELQLPECSKWMKRSIELCGVRRRQILLKESINYELLDLTKEDRLRQMSMQLLPMTFISHCSFMSLGKGRRKISHSEQPPIMFRGRRFEGTRRHHVHGCNTLLRWRNLQTSRRCLFKWSHYLRIESRRNLNANRHGFPWQMTNVTHNFLLCI